MLIGEGMKKYGRDAKAVVTFMQRHSEVLGDQLRDYYQNIGTSEGPSINKAMGRVRKIAKKSLDKARYFLKYTLTFTTET